MLFIIGNGFDLAMGLKTSYKDFVDWYIKQWDEKEDERLRIFKTDIGVDIENDINSWADLEIKLGEYTEKYTDPEDFLFVYRDMKEKLNEYIKNQESNILITSSNQVKKDLVKNELLDFILNFYNGFPSKIRNKFIDIIDKSIEFAYYQKKVSINFLTLNYTTTLEKCIKLLPGSIKKPHLFFENRNCSIGQTLHIHGTVDNSPIIGVDSITQIRNESFRENQGVILALVKPHINEALEEGVAEDARALIDACCTICIYGVSLGDSDKSWWEYIGIWLLTNFSNNLVIFWHKSEELSPLHSDIRVLVEMEVKNLFKTKAGLSDAAYEEIKHQIYVRVHNNIFNFKLI